MFPELRFPDRRKNLRILDRGNFKDKCVREINARKYGSASSSSTSVLLDVLDLDGGPDFELGPRSIL